MKTAFLDIPVVGLFVFFLISSLVSIDRWASLAGSYGVWRDGFFVLFFLIAWYFFGARLMRLEMVWRFGFVIPILSMVFLGILAQSFVVTFLGLSTLLFFHVARKLKGIEKPLWQGSEILVIAILFFVLLLLGAFPLSSFLPFQDSMLDFANSWNTAFSSLFESPKNFLFGTGPGTFSLDVARYQVSTVEQTGSQFAEILATLGVTGSALYLLLFGLVFFRLALSSTDRTQGFLAALLCAVFGAYLLSRATLPLSFLFWTLAGVAREKTFPVLKIAKPLTRLGTLVLAGFVLFMGVRVLGAEVLYQKAKRELNSVTRISLLETAQRINPYETVYKIQLAKLYTEVAKKEVRGEVSSSEAVKAIENALFQLRGGERGGERFRGAIETGRARPEAWEALGVFYGEIQGVPGAKEWGVKAFETAISLSPKNPRLYTELGMFYTMHEEFELAKEQFQKALSLSPNFFDALLSSALLEEKKGNGTTALLALEKLAAQNTGRQDILFQLGRMYYNEGRLKDAEYTFKQVLLLNPNDSNTHYALGVLYEKTKRVKEAIGEFTKVLELHPNDSAVLMKLNQLTQ